jgi:tRNA(Ile)-lysidine synthase
MGIEAEILRWSGAKPRRGIQQAAREARYRLLFQACGQRGILHLLVAHHADDQSETIAMRAARDSGADGLAGMAALLEQPQARLLRPLLAVPRERLTATLQARRVNWIDDPSNDDPRFERVRVRGKAATPIEVWHRAADSRAAHEKALAKAAVELLEFESAGGAAIDRSLYARLGEDQQRRLLSRLVQALGGGHHPPRRARLIQAAARLSQGGDRGKSGKSQDFTLFGCRLMLRQVRQSRRTRWNVGPESGRNESKNRAQPLIPAAFFACGPAGAHHLDS